MPSLSASDRFNFALADDSLGVSMRVSTGKDRFRDEFFSFDTTNAWELLQTGAGQTISLAGASGGARYLNIATGTTNNSETIIQSRQAFYLPVKLAFALSMSQRIANQEVFVELVGVNDAGVVETDATFASTNLNNASNAASIKFDGTTATNAIHIVRGFAVSELASTSTAYLTTAATGTSPNFFPATIFEIGADPEELVFQARSVDSVAAVTFAGKRTQSLPDPSRAYKVRVRVRNLTGAASSTDVRLHFVRVLDATRLLVDTSRTAGRSSDLSDSLPVLVTSMPALPAGGNAIGSLAAGTAAIGDVGVQYRASATGAASRAHIVSAATTNATNAKATAGRVLGWSLSNTSASWRYVKLHNSATAPTAGASVFMTIGIPPNAVSNVVLEGGVGFSAGIGYTIVTGAADADATAVGASEVVGDLYFA